MNRIMAYYLVAAISLLGIAGCATLTKGSTQTVVVNTPGVSGAMCTLTSASIGTQTVVTPASVTLKKGGDNIAVRCSKECYEDSVGTLPSSLEGMTAGNIVFGGFIGLGVDAATGAMNNYAPEVQVAMAKSKICKKKNIDS